MFLLTQTERRESLRRHQILQQNIEPIYFTIILARYTLHLNTMYLNTLYLNNPNERFETPLGPKHNRRGHKSPSVKSARELIKRGERLDTQIYEPSNEDV